MNAGGLSVGPPISMDMPLVNFTQSSNRAGLGFRPFYYKDIFGGKAQEVEFFEAITENYMDTGGRPLYYLEKMRAEKPVFLHGVSLNIGSTDELNQDYLRSQKRLIDRIEPEIVSDHLCWTGAHSKNFFDLYPLPFIRQSLDHCVERISRIQDFLGRRIAVENVSSYLLFKDNEMAEWEFIAEVAKGADCRILLDINNVYVNSVNHAFNPQEFIEYIPGDRVVQYHLAGHTDMGDFLFDTHDHPIVDPVWELFSFTMEQMGSRPTLIERDDKFPELEELLTELRYVKTLILHHTAQGNQLVVK